jgi:acetyl-CoA carboxylase biotin carboxyl carrier protein
MARDDAQEVPLERDGPSQERRAQNGSDHQAIVRLADELLPLLIARLGASSLGELEIRRDGWRVRLRRGIDGAAGGAVDNASVESGPPARSAARSDGPADAERSQRRRERGRMAVTSPAVGYYQPRDGLTVGMSVRGGDLLGHVDVLGVRQDVVAPDDGIVAALAAQAGEAVEYGQPLARLEPESRS